MKPILFNGDMVRAILEGRKTVTRRVIKPQPIYDGKMWRVGNNGCGWGNEVKKIRLDSRHTMSGFLSPYQPGDILYVRETWMYIYCHRCGNGIAGYCFNGPPDDRGGCYMYRASHEIESGDARWHPSIHMPREAARLFLRVTDVRVERLKDMEPDGARKEGFWTYGDFMRAWDGLIRPKDRDLYGWNANPWVWVIEFKRISKEEAKKWIG